MSCHVAQKTVSEFVRIFMSYGKLKYTNSISLIYIWRILFGTDSFKQKNGVQRVNTIFSFFMIT